MAPSTCVKVQVPATTANLGPGFDCLGMALALYNTVALSPHDTTSVQITGAGAGTLPRDRSHLVLQAADTLARQAGRAQQGWHLVQHNEIPLARGLGSSSAAIVGGLVACNELLGLGCTRDELLQVAASLEGHPDNVAPALYGGLTVCCPAGNRVDCLSFSPPAHLQVVVAIPEFEVNTEQARRVLPEHVPHADAVFNTSHAVMTFASLISGHLELLGQAMQDRLHQPYRAHLVPGLQQACQAAIEAGAHGAALSGSGPTIVAFVSDNATAVGCAMQDALRRQGVSATTLVLPIAACGAQVVNS